MISTTEERKKRRSPRRAEDDVSKRGQEKPRSGRKAVKGADDPQTFATETHTLAQYQDTDGKLDLDNAPALIVVDKGLEM